MKPRSSPKPQMKPQKRLPAHELFPQPGVYRPQSFQRAPQRRKNPPPLLWGIVFLCLLVLGFGLLGLLRRPHAQAPFALVEVRAIEENGHPVAAARLTINEKSMGVTDSFGEWRRYMRLQPGDEIAFELVKGNQDKMQGKKSMRVPRFKAGEKGPEVRVTIELRSSQPQKGIAQKRVKRSPAPTFAGETAGDDEGALLADRAESEDAAELAHDANPIDGRVKPSRGANAQKGSAEDEDALASDAPVGDSNDASLGIYFDDGLSAISVQSKINRQAPGNLLEKHQGEILQKKIMPLLAGDLEKLGLRIQKNAPWQLTLEYVPKEDQVGYIRAQINWPNPFGQKESTAFIAGFAKTFDETVRALSSLLRVHMKKSYWAFKDNGRWYIDEASDTKTFWRLRPNLELSDTNGLKFPIRLASQQGASRRWQLDVKREQPCYNVRQRLRCLVSTQSLKDAPPLVGWEKRHMQMQGLMPKNAELFVAGFQAVPVGGGRWEYWGHPGSNHKALVISEGRILYSEIFADQLASQTILKLPPLAQSRQARR